MGGERHPRTAYLAGRWVRARLQAPEAAARSSGGRLRLHRRGAIRRRRNPRPRRAPVQLRRGPQRVRGDRRGASQGAGEADPQGRLHLRRAVSGWTDDVPHRVSLAEGSHELSSPLIRPPPRAARPEPDHRPLGGERRDGGVADDARDEPRWSLGVHALRRSRRRGVHPRARHTARYGSVHRPAPGRRRARPQDGPGRRPGRRNHDGPRQGRADPHGRSRELRGDRGRARGIVGHATRRTARASRGSWRHRRRSAASWWSHCFALRRRRGRSEITDAELAELVDSETTQERKTPVAR